MNAHHAISVPPTTPRSCRGLTLVELMIGIAVLGILLAVGIPAVRDMVAVQRVKATASDLHFSLIFARSEAIKRNTNVTIAPLSGSWANGWQVTASGVGSPLKTENASTGLSVHNPASTTIPPSSLTFSRSGRLSGSGGEIRLYAVDPADATLHLAMRCVSVATSGRPVTDFDVDNTINDGCD